MKNTTNNFWVITCLCLFMLIGVYACSNTDSNQETAKTEQAAPTQKGKSWPTEIPGSVPQFTAGQLMEANTNHTAENMTWVLKFSNTEVSDVAAYKELLSKEGFNPSAMPLNNGTAITIGQKEKLTVTISFNDGLTTVGVNQAK